MKVIFASPRFVSAHELEFTNRDGSRKTVSAKRFCISTGSRPGRDVNKERDPSDSCVRRPSHGCSGTRTPFEHGPACRVVALVEFMSCLNALVALGLDLSSPAATSE